MVDEAKQILSTGYDYPTEKSVIMFFRRLKRFANQNLQDKRRNTMITLK